MNEDKQMNKIVFTAKELARIAVFIGLVIAAQFLLSSVPGVEIVTLLFAAFSFVYGCIRGVISAVAFAILRQFLFGFFPTVLVLYLLYYPLLAAAFGLLGKWINGWQASAKKEIFTVVFAASIACVCTVLFTLADNLLTPWILSYTPKAARLYFQASLPFLCTQLISVSVSVGLLFYPLTKALFLLKSRSR